MSAELICMIAGLFISAAVSAFKKLSFVQDYPKVVAFVLSAAVALVSQLTIGEMDWVQIAQCVLVPFTVAVATYEVQKTLTSPTA